MNNFTILLLFALAIVFSILWVVVVVRTAIQRPPRKSLTPRIRVLIVAIGAAMIVIGVLLVIEGIHKFSQT